MVMNGFAGSTNETVHADLPWDEFRKWDGTDPAGYLTRMVEHVERVAAWWPGASGPRDEWRATRALLTEREAIRKALGEAFSAAAEGAGECPGCRAVVGALAEVLEAMTFPAGKRRYAR